MNRAVGPPLSQLLQRLTEVLEQLAADDFDVAVRRQECEQPRHIVHDQSRLAFAHVGTTPLLAQQTGVLERDGRLIRGDIEEKLLGLRRELSRFRSRDDNADVTLHSQPRRRDRELNVGDGYWWVEWPIRRHSA